MNNQLNKSSSLHLASLRWALAAIMAMAMLTARGQTVTHKVQRGETFASIASKYGISESDLREANPNHKTCHAGLTLTIKKKVQPEPAPATHKTTGGTTTAKSETKQQDKGGVATPSSAGAKPSTTTTRPHYNATLSLGKSYLQRKKYNKAIKEFNRVLSSSTATYEDRLNAQELLAQAESGKEARNQKWSNFLDGLQQTSEKLVNLGLAMEDAKLASQGIPVPLRVQAITQAQVPANSYLCYSCQGKKICTTCGGYGKKLVRNPTNGATGYQYCFSCGGKQHCIACNGKGYIPKPIITTTPSSTYSGSYSGSDSYSNSKSGRTVTKPMFDCTTLSSDVLNKLNEAIDYFNSKNYHSCQRIAENLSYEGYTQAMELNGFCYYNNEDFNSALRMFEKAAAKGTVCAATMCVLAELYLKVKDDKYSAKRWARKALDKGGLSDDDKEFMKAIDAL